MRAGGEPITLEYAPPAQTLSTRLNPFAVDLPLPDWITAPLASEVFSFSTRDGVDDGAYDGRRIVTLLAPHRGETALTHTSLLGRALASRGRLRADAWSDFDGTTRFGGQLVATTWLRMALDAEGYVWDSDLPAAPDGRFGGKFYTGDANVVAEVVSHARGTMRTGAGVAFVQDHTGELMLGPQATVALDANLLGAATAGFEIDYGEIDGDELFRWRTEAGWVWGGAELRAGYDRLTLGDEGRGGWFASLLLRY